MTSLFATLYFPSRWAKFVLFKLQHKALIKSIVDSPDRNLRFGGNPLSRLIIWIPYSIPAVITLTNDAVLIKQV